MSRLPLAVACLFLAARIAVADNTTVSVGGTSIALPAPAGFFRYDGKSARVDAFEQKLWSASGNRLLAVFGSEETLADVLLDRFPKIERNFSVQVMRSLESLDVGASDFNEMKPEWRSSLSSPKFSDLGKEVETSAFVAVGAKLSVGEMICLGVFDDTSDSLCFSMLMKAQLASTSYVSFVACSITRVRGRLVYLYASAEYSDKSDIEWARRNVKLWRDAVLNANAR